MNNTKLIIKGANEHHENVMDSMLTIYHNMPMDITGKDDLYDVEGDLISLNSLINNYLHFVRNAISDIQFAEKAREKALKYNNNKVDDDESE